MVVRYRVIKLTQIVLYHLITAVGYVYKTGNDIGCFDNEVDR